MAWTPIRAHPPSPPSVEMLCVAQLALSAVLSTLKPTDACELGQHQSDRPANRVFWHIGTLSLPSVNSSRGVCLIPVSQE